MPLLPVVASLFRLAQSTGSPRLGALLPPLDEAAVLVGDSPVSLRLGAWVCRDEVAVRVGDSSVSPRLGAWLCRVEGAVHTGESRAGATLPRRDCSGDAVPLGAADAHDDIMIAQGQELHHGLLCSRLAYSRERALCDMP